jgi:hypothetical protein
LSAVGSARPLIWMAGASVTTWLAATGLVEPGARIDVFLGMFGPLAAVATTWVLAERVYRESPGRLTLLMIAGFVGKLVFFAAYVAIVLGVFSHHPVPFVVSFTSYFIALYLMEAVFLRRLFAGGPHPSR